MHWIIRTIPGEDDLVDFARDCVLELVSRTGMPIETILGNLMDSLAVWDGLRSPDSQASWSKYRGGEMSAHSRRYAPLYRQPPVPVCGICTTATGEESIDCGLAGHCLCPCHPRGERSA